MDKEKVIKGLEQCRKVPYVCDADCPYYDTSLCREELKKDILAMLKEQETEIRQLRLALDIAKGTCKGIAVETDEKFMGDL